MSRIVETLRNPSFAREAMGYALNRNPALLDIASKRVFGLAQTAALEIAAFEEIALTNPFRVPKTPEEAKRIVAIWDVSAIGTYLKEFQDDRWKNTPWAGWTDRRRLNYSATLTRKLTEIITGESYQTPLGARPTGEQIEKLRSDIEKIGPSLVYGSTAEQNQDVEEALQEPGVIIPKTKVHIIYDPEKSVGVNTIDQVKSFSLSPGLELKDGDILAMVGHAPHLVRTSHILNCYRPFPDGLVVQPHPLPSPRSAGLDYAIQEISGLLYYTFITGDSSERIHPYEL